MHQTAKDSKRPETLIKHNLILTPLERRPHHALIMCHNIFKHVIHRIYIEDTEHFTFITEKTTQQEAEDHIMHNIKKSSHKSNLPSRLPLPKKRIWKNSHCPNAIPLIKAKTTIDLDNIHLKVRPLISQYKHPIRNSLIIASSAIKSLLKVWRDSDDYHGFEMIKMTDLPSIIDQARHTWPNDTEQILKIEEWDIDDMFNNIPLNKAMAYLKQLIKEVKRLITRSSRLDIYIHIGKTPDDDHISTSNHSIQHTTISTSTLIDIIHFDFDHNKLFRLGKCIIQQKKGTAQGVYISSEIACLYVDRREHREYRTNDLIRSPVISRHKHNSTIR